MSLNRAINVINSQGTTLYGYDRSSLLDTVQYPNGTQSETTYDNARRTSTISYTLGIGSTISSFAYDYDENGNRISQTEINGRAAEETSYDYDTLDRLTEVTYPDNITTYTYDAVYNRDTETQTALDGVTTLRQLDYDYNARNQLTSITDLLYAGQSASYQ